MIKRARWIRRSHLFRKDDYECSACGYRAKRPSAKCPRCGVPMRGEKYDRSWVDEMEEFDAISGE